jgi:glucarate dehydratase
MRITGIKATPVRVPVTRPGVMSRALRTHVSRTIVEIETDTGLVGLGETRGEWSASIIRDKFARHAIGKDPWDDFALRDACLLPHIDYGFPELVMEHYAFAGIDLALWDLRGKQTGRPVYTLLGGAVRDRAPFVAYAYTVDPTEGRAPADVPRIMAEIARAGIAETGATMFEFKVGRHPVEIDIDTALAIRDAVGPGIALTCDVNMGFNLDKARRFLSGAAAARLANIEEPTAELADMARLRREFPVEMSTHCWHLDALVPYPEIDSVVSDIHLHGGIAPTLAFAERVRAMGRRFWLRSMWELGISWAAMCHVGVARAELDRPAQTLINWVADDLVLGPTWLVRDGGVRPPDLPGWGVELDRAALARHAVS